MLGYKDAERIILNNHKGWYVTKAVQLRNLFVFILDPDDYDGGTMIDNIHAVDRRTGKEVPFSPMSDPKAFNQALQNSVVYSRS